MNSYNKNNNRDYRWLADANRERYELYMASFELREAIASILANGEFAHINVDDNDVLQKVLNTAIENRIQTALNEALTQLLKELTTEDE